MWPVPNTLIGGNGNWFAAKLHTFDQRKDTGAVDVNVNDKQRLRFRLTNYTYLEYQPLDGNTDRTPKFFNRPNKTGSLKLRLDHQSQQSKRGSRDRQRGHRENPRRYSALL